MIKLLIILIIINGLVAAGAVWYVQLPTTESVTKSEDKWSLPPLPSMDKVAQSYIKLLKLHPWKIEVVAPAAPAPVVAAPPVAPKPASASLLKRDWQLVGIVQRGEQRYVLVLDKQNKVKSYSVKNVLPNGALLFNIQNDFIEVVLKNGKMEKVELYE